MGVSQLATTVTFRDLPTEIIQQIFQMCIVRSAVIDRASLAVLPLPCRGWAAIFRSRQLWVDVCACCRFTPCGSAVGVVEPAHVVAWSLSAAALVWGQWTQGSGSEKGAAVQIAGGGVRAFIRTSRTSFVALTAVGGLTIVETTRTRGSGGSGVYDALSTAVVAPERIVDAAQTAEQCVLLGASGTVLVSPLSAWTWRWCKETGADPATILEPLHFDCANGDGGVPSAAPPPHGDVLVAPAGIIDGGGGGDGIPDNVIQQEQEQQEQQQEQQELEQQQEEVERIIGSIRPYNRPKITALSCAKGHMLCGDTEGGLWVWGQNEAGQLGLGDRNPRSRLTPVLTMLHNRSSRGPPTVLQPPLFPMPPLGLGVPGLCCTLIYISLINVKSG
eukprot:COSAG05_NODE_3109_length_2318_cov_1.494817_3_plen_388_part_00